MCLLLLIRFEIKVDILNKNGMPKRKQYYSVEPIFIDNMHDELDVISIAFFFCLLLPFCYSLNEYPTKVNPIFL